MRYRFPLAAVALTLALLPMGSNAQTTSSDADYMAKVMTAAPASVVKGATIVQIQKDGSMRTLQSGTNGFTCMVIRADPMCADRNAMAWMHAIVTHSAPPDSVGFAYMLAGDRGASNTDPYATAKTDSNHWVQTGPHVMIVGPNAKTMGYPMTADADPTKPFVMWANTPYAHVMLPVSVSGP
jgi:hypothetical protein